MSFILGLDVGTASGAGATKRDGRVHPCALGDRTATLPAVVVTADDGSTLIGEDAERVAGLELTRIARDVRSDPRLQETPIVVGGTVHTPHEQLRALYSSMVERVCLSHNAVPTHIVLTHPPVPEGERYEMVEGVAEELFPGALVVPEPIAATVKLACDGALAPDCVVAVYDLGGGSFSATLVHRQGDRFSMVGNPGLLPHFGGIDIDDLVLDHVDRSLDGAISGLDLDNPDAMAALTALRSECRAAKERLSYQTEVTIDATLPEMPALVQLTRVQFEDFLLPSLEPTIDVLDQLIADTGLQPDDIGAIALVGGSSRIPLVVELATSRTNIPVLVDPYPELTVALGAAQMVDDEAPTSSVFPFAELALPSLSALAASGAGEATTLPEGSAPVPEPVGGPLDDSMGEIGGDFGSEMNAGVAGMGAGVGAGLETSVQAPDEFESLMDRARRLETDSPHSTRSPDEPSTVRNIAREINPRTLVAILGAFVGALVLAAILLQGGGDSPDNETAGLNDDSTTTSSTTSTTRPRTGAAAPAATPTPSTESTTTTEGSTSSTSPPQSGVPAPPPSSGPPPPPPPPPSTTSTTTTSTTTSTTTTSTTTTTIDPPPPESTSTTGR